MSRRQNLNGENSTEGSMRAQRRHIIKTIFVIALVLFTCVMPSGHAAADDVAAAAKDPFYCRYEHDLNGAILIEGTVKTVSAIPDPRKNDYPDCLYSVMFDVNSVLSNERSRTEIAKEVMINVPIMKGRQILRQNVLTPGDKIVCECVPYDQMPGKIKEIQISDDIQSFEHQYYYAVNINKIRQFSHSENQNFASREITILPIRTLPKDETAAGMRRERMQKEILRIEDELKKHGGSFAKWKKEYRPVAEKYRKLYKEGRRGWIGNSYFAVAGPEMSFYKTDDFISGILPFKKYLEQNNIDLIIVRIPSKWDFAARVFASEDFQENPAWIENYYKCLKNDIEIVDPMYEMWKERFDHPLFYFYQTDSEAHPFEGMYLPAARLLAEVLSRYDVEKDDGITLGDAKFGPNAYKDERRFYPPGNKLFSDGDVPRQLSFKCILLKNQKVGRLKTYGGSPILFLSNSYFGITYMQDQGASLPHYTCYYLKHMADWKYQNGMGNIMLRSLISDPKALNRRKAVVMVVSWASFGGGFSVFPKYLTGNTNKIVLVKTIRGSDMAKNVDADIETKIADNMVLIKAKKDSFSIDLDIPPMPNYKHCMIRFNLPVCYIYTKMTVADPDNRPIDRSDLTSGKNLKNDLFVPASPSARKISVVVKPSGNKYFAFGINDVEIWGF